MLEYQKQSHHARNWDFPQAVEIISELLNELNATIKKGKNFHAKWREVDAQLNEARKVLEWYASETNYHWESIWFG